MSATDGLGDRHEGQRVPFWQNACITNASGACQNLALILDGYCQQGSGWACNEVGALRTSALLPDAAQRAVNDFSAACAKGTKAGCENLLGLPQGGTPRVVPPTVEDYAIVLRAGKSRLSDETPIGLFTRACADGWINGCERLARAHILGEGTPRDPARAATSFQRACEIGSAAACSNLGLMHHRGDGIPQDTARGLSYLQRACDLKFANACRWLEEARAGGVRP